MERFGRLDVLYNNAGVMLPDDGSVHTTTEAIWDLDARGQRQGRRVRLQVRHPGDARDGGGSIINVASFVAWMGAATSQTAYTASKGAVLAMTREIAVEYARKGIRCNALCPGPIETPLLMQLLSDDEKRQRRFVHIPMGRLGRGRRARRRPRCSSPRDDSSFMTGASLIVDGGITAAYVTPRTELASRNDYGSSIGGSPADRDGCPDPGLGAAGSTGIGRWVGRAPRCISPALHRRACGLRVPLPSGLRSCSGTLFAPWWTPGDIADG